MRPLSSWSEYAPEWCSVFLQRKVRHVVVAGYLPFSGLAITVYLLSVAYDCVCPLVYDIALKEKRSVPTSHAQDPRWYMSLLQLRP